MDLAGQTEHSRQECCPHCGARASHWVIERVDETLYRIVACNVCRQDAKGDTRTAR